MFKSLRDIIYELKTLNRELGEIKLLLNMFIIAQGMTNNLESIPKMPTDDELKKEGYIINPTAPIRPSMQDQNDFYGYNGPLPNQTEDELLDATIPAK